MNATPSQARDCLGETDVIILAGGLGTRIKRVLGTTPKVLAPIGGRVFLSLLLHWLGGFGAKRIIIGLGHLSGEVETYLARNSFPGLDIQCLVEPHPLGTGGAIAFLCANPRSDPLMVVNGDSFVDADLCAFLNAHREAGAQASILCTSVAHTGRYGSVELDRRGWIRAFREKAPAGGPGLINAGVYLLGASIIRRLRASGASSLERHILQRMEPGALFGHAGDFTFIDIGTPEDLTRAASVLEPFARPASGVNP